MNNTIEKSGTGIERSGTGVERSGTGSTFKLAAIGLGAAIALASAFNVSAMEPQVLVTRNADTILVSLHSSQSIFIGSMPVQSGAGDYFSVSLYEVNTGTKSIAADSGLMTQGSGGGTPGASCNPGGSGLMTQGSGGGSANDGEADCMNKILPWGSAELVFDPAGTSIIVHRNGQNGPEEFMVEFIAGSPTATADFNAEPLTAKPRNQLRSVALH